MINQATVKTDFPYQSAIQLYKKANFPSAKVLFESHETDKEHGRLSLLGVDPSLEIKGTNNDASVKLINPRGEAYFNFIKDRFKAYVKEESGDTLYLHISKIPFSGKESDRFKRQNIAQIIKQTLEQFKCEEKNFVGFYGALGYNFVYQFEDVDNTKENASPDFHLFLYDTIVFFNHLTKETRLYCTRESKEQAIKDSNEYVDVFLYAKAHEYPISEISNISITPSDEDFKKQVAEAKELCRLGELMEIVLARKISADFEGSPIHIYEKYKEINPSPYMFYFDFEGEYILGASPEIMVRYEDDRITLKPISGTIKRGKDAIQDHERMMELLNSNKEKSELDMLIDLGRNDLSRICKPGIEIEHYRKIEKYSHVFHTVAELSGELQDDKSGFDGLVSCLNAGTLTGTPKVAAMRNIERIEQFSRGYYGGAVGYFLLDGDVNTAITIRTAHIKEKQLEYCSGATLLYECDPDMELKETLNKAAAFMSSIKDFTHETVI
jgi:anthranilate/para-aminobenzoate synthase component I